MTKPIYPCLWFDGQAQAAAAFYCSIFKDAKITQDNQMVVTFELNGTRFMGLNAGPQFKFNEAVSFVVECDTQDEIDYYWEQLTAGGGSEGNCGWLKDKFGISWQIVPSVLPRLLSNPAKAQNVMQAYMKMKKFNIQELENA
ncbi:VOC family protein [Chitinophagaceae bacterium MMS25-I14]